METPNDTSPDDLMKHFRGRSLKSIVIFTVVIHAVVILGTSIPYMLGAFGAGTDDLSDEERNQLAVKEATSKLREIAEEYGMQPQQLSDQLKGRKTAPPAPAAETPDTENTTAAPESATPDEPKSEIEKQLEKAEPGPALPPVEEADDLFK